MVKPPVLQRHRDDVRERVIQRLAAGIGVGFLRIVGATADNVVHGAVGTHHRLAQPTQVDTGAQLEGQVDEGLGMIDRRMRLREGLENRAQGLARCWQRYVVAGIGTVEHVGDHPALSFVGRTGRGLVSHGAIDRVDGKLARMARDKRLPGRHLAFAGLARGMGNKHGLIERMIDGGHGQPQKRPQARRGSGTQMAGLLFLRRGQRDASPQCHLNLVGHGNGAHQRRAVASHLLGHGDQGGDVVPGMGAGRRTIVKVQLSHRGRIGPCGPLGMHPDGRWEPEQRRPTSVGVGQGHDASRGDRPAIDRRQRHPRIVDDATGDHLGHLGRRRRRGRGQLGQLPRQLRLSGQLRRAGVHPYLMHDHRRFLSSK